MRAMQKLVLFDLDDTLVDRRSAFNAWAEEFAAARGLGDRDLTFMVMADAHHSGPMDGFFAMICETFGLTDDPGVLWQQYRRRMPELVSCRAEDLDALRRLRVRGWRIGIVSKRHDRQPARKDQQHGFDSTGRRMGHLNRGRRPQTRSGDLPAGRRSVRSRPRKRRMGRG